MSKQSSDMDKVEDEEMNDSEVEKIEEPNSLMNISDHELEETNEIFGEEREEEIYEVEELPKDHNIAEYLEVKLNESEDNIMELINNGSVFHISELSNFMTKILSIMNIKIIHETQDNLEENATLVEIFSTNIREYLLQTESRVDEEGIVHIATFSDLKSILLQVTLNTPQILFTENENEKEETEVDKIETPFELPISAPNPDDQDLFVNNIDQSIVDYRLLAKRLKKEGKETQSILHLLDTLKIQKDAYIEKIAGNAMVQSAGAMGSSNRRQNYNMRNNSKLEANPSQLTLHEKWERGIKEIFYSYAKQQYLIGNKPTFDQIDGTMKTIYLGSYMKFCKDFVIPLKLTKVRELFKKHAHHSKDMKLVDFQFALQKIADEIVTQKKEEIEEKLKMINPTKEETNQSKKRKGKGSPRKLTDKSRDKETVSPRNIESNEEMDKKSTNQQHRYDKEILQPTGKEGAKKISKEDEIGHLENELKYLESKSEKDRLIELYEIMECDDLAKFRKKIKSFALPFNIKDDFRIPREDNSIKYIFKSDKTAEDIKKQVKLLKERRLNEKRLKELEDKEKYERNRQILKRIHLKQKKEKALNKSGKNLLDNEEKEGDLSEENGLVKESRERKSVTDTENKNSSSKSQKMTLQSIEKLTYSDINQHAYEDEFRPQDFLNDSDDEDLDILRKYKKGDSSISKTKPAMERKGGKPELLSRKELIKQASEEHKQFRMSENRRVNHPKTKIQSKLAHRHNIQSYRKKENSEQNMSINIPEPPPEFLMGGEGGMIYGEGFYNMYPQQYGGPIPGYPIPPQGGAYHPVGNMQNIHVPQYSQHPRLPPHPYHKLTKSIDYLPNDLGASLANHSARDIIPIYKNNSSHNINSPSASIKNRRGVIGNAAAKKKDISYEILDRAKEIDINERKKRDIILQMQDRRNQQRGFKSLPRK